MICITTIKEQVAKVIGYSQNIKNVQPQAMIDKWYNAKKKFIEAWGDCIYTVPEPVTFYLSAEEKRHRFNEFIEVVDNTYGNFSLTEFLDWLTIEEVFDNRTNRDFWVDDCTKIPSGTKVGRALKYFESNETVLRKVQDQLSMILQEDKITGTLCLSVHPLDFLSASENTYHWRSCHALDGDYRAGNLSYMMDSCTVICYLRGEKDVVLPHFPEDVLWNSKKWRMLLFVSDVQNAMFAGRQYPFFSPSAMDCVQEAFLTSMDKRVRAWTPWYNDFIKKFPRFDGEVEIENADCDGWLDGRYISMGGTIFPTRSIIKEPQQPLFFNDLLDSSIYVPYYSWNRYANSEYQFNIGDTVPCPGCNGKHNLYEGESMLCRHCQEQWYEDNSHYYCECCDASIRRSEACYVQGSGQILCPACYEDNVACCERCGSDWLKSYIQFDRETEQHLCPHCRTLQSDEQWTAVDDTWLELPF